MKGSRSETDTYRVHYFAQCLVPGFFTDITFSSEKNAAKLLSWLTVLLRSAFSLMRMHQNFDA